MFTGGWCGAMGVGGCLMMVAFWGAFLALTVWAVTRMFPSGTTRKVQADPLEDLGGRPAAADVDADNSRRVRDDVAGAGPPGGQREMALEARPERPS